MPFSETASIVINAKDRATAPIRGISNSLGNMKQLAAGAGAALGAFMTYKSVKAATSFEKTMTNSLQMFKGVSEAQREELSETAKKMGTTYGVGAKSAAEALYFLGSAGLDAKQSQAALGDVLKYASTSMLDSGRASEVALTAMKNWNYGTEDMEKVISRLELTVSNAQMTTNQLADSFSYVAPVANKAGMSIAETGAMLGVLADAGIRGSKAGTTLRRAMVNLIRPTGQTKEAMKKLGLSSEIYAQTGGDMIETLEIIFNRMEGLTDAQKQQVSAQLFGTRAVAGMTSVLSENIEGIEDRAEAIDNDTEAQRRFNEKQDTMAFRASRVKAQFEELQITMGMALLPTVKNLSTVFGWVGKQFNALPGPLQEVLGWLGPIATVFGVLYLVGKPLSGLIGGIAGALGIGTGSLAAAASSALGPIVAAAAGFIATYFALEKLDDSPWERIIESFALLISPAAYLADQLDEVDEDFRRLKDFLTGLDLPNPFAEWDPLSGILGIGVGDVGQWFQEHVIDPLSNLDIPSIDIPLDLSDLSWPDLPSLSDLSWPELPDLGDIDVSWPDQLDISWPELPDWHWPSLPDFNWPSLPDWSWPQLPNLSWPDFSWPDLPDWSWPSFPDFSWPELPNLSALSWPELPDLDLEGIDISLPDWSWPELPDWDWPSLPGWLTGWDWPSFSWPSLPDWHWPSLPNWHWPGLPDWNWPAVPDWEWDWPAVPDWEWDWPSLPDWSWPSFPDWSWPPLPWPLSSTLSRGTNRRGGVTVNGDVIVRANDPNEFRRKLARSNIRRL